MHGSGFEIASLYESKTHGKVSPCGVRLQFDGFVQMFNGFGVLLLLGECLAHGVLRKIGVRL